jgi:hypothetical protein
MRILNPIAFVAFLVLILFMTNASKPSYSQFIPVPPPSGNPPPQVQNVQQNGTNSAISNPPSIDFLTPSLKEGKNVFSVKVVGSAPIQLVQIKQASGGKVIATKMSQEGLNIYKMLLDAQGPSKVIVIRAFDINGRYSEAVKLYDVQQSQDVIGSLKNFFGGLFK